jgi:hypothetical protein
VKDPEYFSTYIADYLEDTLKVRAPETDIWLGTLSNDATYDALLQRYNIKSKKYNKAVGPNGTIPLRLPSIQVDYIAIQTEHQCGKLSLGPRRKSFNS